MSDKYEVVRREYIEDVRSECTLLRHRKSGARIVLLANDDDNKVFNIAFRTPPADSTGVAHIVEHTVLCGSEKFPLKDPFVELAKGSLNTFLNAMTFPDKTMYPVGSCNDTDFRNLMEVYLDAVFYPNIYREEKIFRQEGWHYHIEDRNDPLTYNGVVYNEMKGVFSSADELLQRSVFNTLFPDTPYGVESGGDPDVIPELTYESFLDFHRRYYHPSNSYIYLYGNMDMEERLDWLDTNYLSAFNAIQVDSEIPLQKQFDSPVKVRAEYPILDDETEEGKTYLAWSTVVGDYSDVTRNIAFSILEYVLLSAPGAPVKQALLDAGIGRSVDSSYEDGIIQPFLTIVARQAGEEDSGRFEQVIRDTLGSIAEEGIDRRALASGINYFEFRFREADYASYPKGLIYSIDLFDSWLYDEDDPFAYLRELAVFDELKKKADEGYFEDLIRNDILGNRHHSHIVLVPKKGLAAEREAALAAKLAEYKAGLSDEQIDSLIEETRMLQEYQEKEDAPEVIATIPLLSIDDISKKIPVPIMAEEKDYAGTRALEHHYATNGIAYLNLLFDTKDVPEDRVPYLGLLRNVLGHISTENYTHGELFHEINANSGGISFSLSAYPVNKGEDGDVGYMMLGIQAKYLYPQQGLVFRMIREILCTSKLDDTKRLREIIDSALSGLQNSLQAAGHATAATRAMSSDSPIAAWTDATGGIRYYRLIEDLSRSFDAGSTALADVLGEIMRIVFRPENLLVSVTADGAGFDGLPDQVAALNAALAENAPSASTSRADLSADAGSAGLQCGRASEAFKTSGQVQYVALAGTYRRAGLPYTGTLRVLKTILSYDYLWMNVRVLGGAYGCMTAAKRSGNGFFVSYRDPHLAETLDIYRKIPEYLRSIEPDERTVTKYVIGTISETDHPMNASAKGAFALMATLAGITEDDIQKERDEILTVTGEDIRALAGHAQAMIDTASICVIGSESAIEDNAELFDSIEPLITV